MNLPENSRVRLLAPARCPTVQARNTSRPHIAKVVPSAKPAANAAFARARVSAAGENFDTSFKTTTPKRQRN
jgi:hypothetical protein